MTLVEVADQWMEWRFFWPHAHDDMNGARWRRAIPTDEEIAEWREDVPSCWLESRLVSASAPRRIGLQEGVET